MPKPRKRRTQADRIRSLIDRGKAPTEVMRATGASHAAVYHADKHRKPVGRPATGLPRERLTVYVKAVTHLRLRDQAAERDTSVGEVVDELTQALRPKEEPNAYAACRQCGHTMLRLLPDELLPALEQLASELATQRLDDREPHHHDQNIATTARIGLGWLLDKLTDHCSGCAPWVSVLSSVPRLSPQTARALRDVGQP